ncbi:hypothetical protein L6164_017973 [Bauhinia variegata]|uniref:Uncharacterized protein n=1 Tax=Bauhinia variegata TaxID=167791 RepID=A0ACB9N9Q9_BAUVA|nr:hypothetical protein L6164_017973 [Bauhinia variegata]
MQQILPILKHSLSLTLQLFFPFAATLKCPLQPHKPHIDYLDGGSVSFTVAESTADFAHLIGYSPQDVRSFHPFVPEFPPTRTSENGTVCLPLMAIQVTVLPCSGFAVCVNFNHVVADGKAFHRFMKSWAFLCRTKGDLNSLQGSIPFHDRAIVADQKGLEHCFLKEWWDSPIEQSKNRVESVRATTTSKNWGAPSLGILADCRNRLEFPLPSTYFGNCLMAHSVALERKELVGENGIVEAVKAIGNKVKNLESGVLRGAEKWISDVKRIRKLGQPRIVVAGSPRFVVYETDFGWVRPKKSEVVQIDATGSIALADSRDGNGGIEVGLALGRTQMNDFVTILENTFKIML